MLTTVSPPAPPGPSCSICIRRVGYWPFTVGSGKGGSLSSSSPSATASTNSTAAIQGAAGFHFRARRMRSFTPVSPKPGGSRGPRLGEARASRAAEYSRGLPQALPSTFSSHATSRSRPSNTQDSHSMGLNQCSPARRKYTALYRWCPSLMWARSWSSTHRRVSPSTPAGTYTRGVKNPNTKAVGMRSLSHHQPICAEPRQTAVASRRRSRSQARAMYPHTASTPASQSHASTSSTESPSAAGAASSGAGTASGRAKLGAGSAGGAGSGAAGRSTISSVRARASVCSCTAGVSQPSTEKGPVTSPTGRSMRTATTSHRSSQARAGRRSRRNSHRRGRAMSTTPAAIRLI